MHIIFIQPVPWFSTPFFVSLRTLWAYGFDSAARRAPEKSKVGEKEKYFISFNQLYFLKSRLRSAIKTGESHPERAWS